MIVATMILFLAYISYPPGKLFCLLAMFVVWAVEDVRMWRRGIRWPTIFTLATLLVCGVLARHAASALIEFRAARRAEPPLVDGTRVGTAEGLCGPMHVQVEVARGKISDVRILSWCDSPSIAGEAVEDTRRRILAQNTPRVRPAPGAPESTAALCRATEEALWSARGPRLDSLSQVVLAWESNDPRRTTFTTLVVLGLVFASIVGLVRGAKA